MIEVVLDTETTGLKVSEGHRIVEIGCIELNNLIPTKKIFHCYLNPERNVSEDALKIHGYDNEFLSKQKKFSEIVDDFLEFIKGKRLVIHNAEFDLAHINNELNLIGKKEINEVVVDTLILAREKFPGSAISLDALCKKYGIDNSRRKKHDAIMDCELLSKVYINLIDQKEPTLDLKIERNIINSENLSSKIKYFNKVIKPTNEELVLHKNFLKKEIKKNYFS